MAKLELLTKQIAAGRLKISVRRLMELSAEGQIKRHRGFDPGTKRKAVMFDASDVERLRLVWNSVPAPRAIEAPAESPRAVVRASDLLAAGERAAKRASAAPEPLRAWLTLAQAAEYTGLPASVLSRFVEQGRLPAIDVGVRSGGHWRVRRLDLDAIEGDRRKGAR